MTRELYADGGVVISASLILEYNGIKFFDGNGFKLPDEVESKLEEFVYSGGTPVAELPGGAEVGVVVPDGKCL